MKYFFINCHFMLCFFAFGSRADTNPIFSDNPSPVFENTYLIDNLGNNSLGADLTLRINKKAPFDDCKNKIDCPASMIISNATGNVNMPVDVNAGSLYVGKNRVIDSNGKWVGTPANLKGDKGDGCSTVGSDIVCGPTKIPLATLKGDKGNTGENGAPCRVVPNTSKIKCGSSAEIDLKLSSCSLVPGTTKIKCGDGIETELKGEPGDPGEPGEGCSMVPRSTKIKCGDQAPVDLVGSKGDPGDSGQGILRCETLVFDSTVSKGQYETLRIETEGCNFRKYRGYPVSGGCELVSFSDGTYPDLTDNQGGYEDSWLCRAVATDKNQYIKASVTCCGIFAP